MDRLKQILKQVLKDTPNYRENLHKMQVFEAWPRAVGDKIARQVWPVRFVEDGVLLVAASSSAWLHSLRYLEADILDKLEKELKNRRVRALRYKLATADKE